MKILCDYHHPDLYRSFELLFTKRLGYELHRMIGLEWAEENIFQIHKLAQFTPFPKNYLARLLSFDSTLDEYNEPIPPCSKLVQPSNYISNKNYWSLRDPISHRKHIGVTYKQALGHNYSLILGSFPDHFLSLTSFRDKYFPSAKIICHVGNYWPDLPKEAVNIITSLHDLFPDRHTIQYHPEFDLDKFSFTTSPNPFSILSLLHRNSSLLDNKNIPPSFSRKHYGLGTHTLNTEDEIAQALRQTGFVWLVKPEGDGYGFTLHRALAMGRPLIYKSSQFNKHMPGHHILQHRINGIDLDKSTSLQEELAWAIDNYPNFSQRTFYSFKQIVNFDNEFEKIKKFLERLQ